MDHTKGSSASTLVDCNTSFDVITRWDIYFGIIWTSSFSSKRNWQSEAEFNKATSYFQQCLMSSFFYFTIALYHTSFPHNDTFFLFYSPFIACFLYHNLFFPFYFFFSHIFVAHQQRCFMSSFLAFHFLLSCNFSYDNALLSSFVFLLSYIFLS